jgi:hypothetical protein
MAGGSGALVYGMRLRRLSSLLGVCVTVFQAEMFAILAFAKEGREMKCMEEQICICSDRQLFKPLMHEG